MRAATSRPIVGRCSDAVRAWRAASCTAGTVHREAAKRSRQALIASKLIVNKSRVARLTAVINFARLSHIPAARTPDAFHKAIFCNICFILKQKLLLSSGVRIVGTVSVGPLPSELGG